MLTEKQILDFTDGLDNPLRPGIARNKKFGLWKFAKRRRMRLRTRSYSIGFTCAPENLFSELLWYLVTRKTYTETRKRLAVEDADAVERGMESASRKMNLRRMDSVLDEVFWLGEKE